MMLVSYPACFYAEETGYSVFVPDFDSATCGDTLEESMEMAIDLIAGLIYTKKQDGEEIPVPSDLVMINPVKVYQDMTDEPLDSHAKYFSTYVTLDPEEYARKHFDRAVKKTLTIPGWLNERAVAANINFSKVLQTALKEQLGLNG